ncbi:Conidial pigment polyketide synthase PfmaE-like protein [Cladobotryum mycophilum]|uniref:Conidial pigment polyketide synthase PfmaE-like protein n=1 Tax=Cladobotryum mycophilum TaxID=491253 RepID=A0ABR0SHY5_9HYPO
MAQPRTSANQLFERVVGLIARELDVSLSELQDDETEFAELGLDAVSAPVIITKISQTLGLKLSEDVFRKARSVGELKKIVTANTSPETKTRNKPVIDPNAMLSILISGDSSASKNLFLLPDGGGTAMVIEELAAVWVEEIQKIQPRGPYVLGGYSAGGYYSFEVMKQLHEQGETVEKLIVIDSPCRTDYDALPADVVRYLAAHNHMGNSERKKIPDWLIEHFEVTLKAVEEYHPTPLAPSAVVPEVFIIWSSEGVLPSGQAAQTGLDLNLNVTRFMLEEKEDFGPNGWNKLLPGAKIAIAKTAGNHFNLVHPPNADILGSLLGDVVQGRLGKWTRIG